MILKLHVLSHTWTLQHHPLCIFTHKKNQIKLYVLPLRKGPYLKCSSLKENTHSSVYTTGCLIDCVRMFWNVQTWIRSRFTDLGLNDSYIVHSFCTTPAPFPWLESQYVCMLTNRYSTVYHLSSLHKSTEDWSLDSLNTLRNCCFLDLNRIEISWFRPQCPHPLPKTPPQGSRALEGCPPWTG